MIEREGIGVLERWSVGQGSFDHPATIHRADSHEEAQEAQESQNIPLCILCSFVCGTFGFVSSYCFELFFITAWKHASCNFAFGFVSQKRGTALLRARLPGAVSDGRVWAKSWVAKS